MNRFMLVVACSVAIAGCSGEYAQPVAPGAVPINSGIQAQPPAQNEFIPLELSVFVPCAAGGVGEIVELTGVLHVLTRAASDDAGGFHIAQHFQPQGVSGLGLVTGDKYQATGVTQDRIHVKAGYIETYVNNFRIVGQGRGNNFLVHETFHVTVNPAGRVTTLVDNFKVGCK